MADKQEMVEQARYEWEQRGFDPADFHLDSMIEIWEREDMEEMVTKQASGAGALAQKQEMIDARKEGALDQKLKKLIVVAEKAYVFAQQEGRKAAFLIQRAVELPHQRRRRQWREHHALIKAQEGTATKEQHRPDPTKARLRRWHIWDKEKTAALERRTRLLAPIKEHNRIAAQTAKEEDHRKELEEMERKQAAWAKEEALKLEHIKDLANRKYEAQERYRRKMNDLYWAKQAKERGAEAHQSASDLRRYRRQELQAAVDDDQRQLQERADEEHALQTGGPVISSQQVLGYGTPARHATSTRATRRRQGRGSQGRGSPGQALPLVPMQSVGAGTVVASQSVKLRAAPRTLGVFGTPMLPGEYANPWTGG